MLLIESFGFRGAGFESAELFLKSDQLHEISCLVVDVRMPGNEWEQLQSVSLPLAAPFQFILLPLMTIRDPACGPCNPCRLGIPRQAIYGRDSTSNDSFSFAGTIESSRKNP